MSATNRGREREDFDHYATPLWCVERVLEKITLPGGLWLEPCAGEGQIIAAVNSLRPDVKWAACELREECLPGLSRHGFDESAINNFLELDVSKFRRFDAVFTNPPYTYAQEFLEKCLQITDNVVFLLRINFLGSEARQAWLSRHMPDIYVLPNRPSFKVFVSDVYFCSYCVDDETVAVPEDAPEPKCQGCGRGMVFKGQKKSSSDATEYAWFHFFPGERTTGKVVMLDTTPKSVRKQAAA